jgi:multicomponent Na+:H+ antiporter subunit C
MSILLAASAAALFGIGTYMVLQRKLSRIIIGLSLMSHGGNVLWLTSGRGGREPLVTDDASSMADPLPHALALTTIVITFGVTAFLLALAFRSWVLTHDDEVENDVADLLVVRGGIDSKELIDEELAEHEVLREQAQAALLAAEGGRDEPDREPVP